MAPTLQDITESDFKEMETHKRAVKSIDDEIEVLMRAIRQLQFRKTQHLVQIKHFQGLTTLARRILPEILAVIIEECVRDGWTRTPLTASHVCSEWRKATKIPTLWSHIFVNCDAKDPCGRTTFWLENAESSSLHIAINVGNDGSRIVQIVNILMKHAPQWQTLAITSNLLCHANLILSLCNHPLKKLRALRISISEEFDDASNLAPQGVSDLGVLDVSTHAPHLRTLCIDRNIILSSRSVPPQITNLSILLPYFHAATKISIDRVLTLLDALPALQQLSISLPHQQQREFEPALDQYRLVNLPDLETLLLVGSSDVFRLLPHLAASGLSRIHLRSSVCSLGYAEGEIGWNIRKFIETASPPLELLDLHDIDLSPSNFAACFTRLPQLKDLRLHESDIPDHVIDMMAQPQNRICPLLSRLDLRWCGQMSGRALVRLANSRIHPCSAESRCGFYRPSSINQITVINCSFVREEDLLALSEMTSCRIMMDSEDYCRPFGCCQNDRYRKRLHQQGLLEGDGKLKGVSKH